MVAWPSRSRVNFLRRARSSGVRVNSGTSRPGAAGSRVPLEFLLAPHSSAGSIHRKAILSPWKKPRCSGVGIASLDWLLPRCARVFSVRLPICVERFPRCRRLYQTRKLETMETSAPTLIVYHAVSRTGGRCGDKIENAEEDALRGQEVRKVIAFSSVIHSDAVTACPVDPLHS